MRCLACEWNAPYVIRASFCPNCGEDGQLKFIDREPPKKVKTPKST